jgi:hypothetical protein
MPPGSRRASLIHQAEKKPSFPEDRLDFSPIFANFHRISPVPNLFNQARPAHRAASSESAGFLFRTRNGEMETQDMEVQDPVGAERAGSQLWLRCWSPAGVLLVHLSLDKRATHL